MDALLDLLRHSPPVCRNKSNSLFLRQWFHLMAVASAVLVGAAVPAQEGAPAPNPPSSLAARMTPKLGIEPGEFNLPHAIALDSRGRLYIADRNNARIQVFAQDGAFLDQWRNIVVPCAFWMTKDDELWVCGSSPMTWRPEDNVLGYPPKDQLFMKFNTSGKLLQLWSVPKGEDGEERPGDLNWVHGLAADSAGNIYAVDVMGRRVQKFVPSPADSKPTGKLRVASVGGSITFGAGH